jgi:hypothetical protein
MYKLLAICLLFIGYHLRAQDSPASSPSQPTTEGSTQVWTDEDWNQAKKGIGYQKSEPEKEEIEREPKPAHTNPTPITEPFSFNNYLKTDTAKIICLAIIIAVLVFIIIRFVLGAKMENSKVKLESFEMLESIEDNLEGTDLNPYLNKALEAVDYKTAVRILYLSIIQKLNDMNWIRWKKDKTNMDFLMEMRSQSSFKTFRNITLSYEIVWYGEALLNSAEFDTLKEEFNSYKNSLNQFEN